MSNSYQKDFKFSIKTKEGKVLIEEVVTFGSKEKPFPKDWEEQSSVISSIWDYKKTMIDKYLDVEIEDEF